MVGYRVEGDEPREGPEVVFVLPGGLMGTEDMREGRIPEQPQWATSAA